MPDSVAPVVLVCPQCGVRSRVPRDRFADVPVCSECRTRLLPAGPVTLSVAGFDRFVSGGDLPVLVDFWASWCGPCRQMAPEFEAAAEEFQGRVLFAKVDTDANRELAARYRIQGIPTVVLLRGGEEVARQSGALARRQIGAWLEQHLG